MAHLIDFSNNKANLAYVGATPWHGLGQKLSDGASVDQWRVEAGLDWSAKRASVQFDAGIVDSNGVPLMQEGEHDVLYRSDTLSQLGIVSPAYKVVQPGEVMEFFRDIVASGGMQLETAGSLDGGRKVWALAKTNQNFRVMGQDEINGYLLLATSFDGTLATRAQFTSVRVVCNNTLQISLKDHGKAIKIPHSSTFCATQAKIDLGILDGAFDQFEEQANVLAGRKISHAESVRYLMEVLAKGEKLEDLSTRKANIIKNVHQLYQGKGMGSNFKSAEGTAWGLVNAVTQYVDHEQGNNINNRFRSAQFGPGNDTKSVALIEALKLVA